MHTNTSRIVEVSLHLFSRRAQPARYSIGFVPFLKHYRTINRAFLQQKKKRKIQNYQVSYYILLMLNSRRRSVQDAAATAMVRRPKATQS